MDAGESRWLTGPHRGLGGLPWPTGLHRGLGVAAVADRSAPWAMDLPSAIGQALLALFLSFPAVAHNGAVGVAPPVQGIVIDGDLSDWPLAARWYIPVYLDAGNLSFVEKIAVKKKKTSLQ